MKRGKHDHRLARLIAYTVMMCSVLKSAIAAEPLHLQQRLRRPVGVAVVGPTSLVVANRIGSLSMIDTARSICHAEVQVGERLTAVAALADGRLAVLDAGAGLLRMLQVKPDGSYVESATQPVEAEPVSLCVNGDRIVVASNWARRLSVFRVDNNSLSRVATVDLHFAPNRMLNLKHGTLLVADAFSGWLAEVDLRDGGSIVATRELLGSHNIDGLAESADGKQWFLAHQALNGYEATTQPNVHWGGVMSNVIRRIDREWLSADPKAAKTDDHFLQYLGNPDRATGDPSGLLITRDNRFIIGLAGVDEIGLSQNGLQSHYERTPVGRRPTDIALNLDETLLYVANRFDDSVSIIDLQTSKAVATISLGPQKALSEVDRGELLFFDAKLSSDGWYSCHSCHTNGHANGGQSDTFGDGYTGAPKQVLSLLGARETGPWSWNGQMPEIKQQIRKSIQTTMRGPEPSDAQLDALVAFVESLEPPVPLDIARQQADHEQVQRGRQLFVKLECNHCHEEPTFTSPETYDVGLEDEEGRHEFNPPSLRGVAHRKRLLHDGSAPSIRAALKVHPQGNGIALTDEEWQTLEAYLRNL